jgi:hypothetical protein
MYETLVPLVEEQIEAHGRIRVVVELHDFHGWTMGALWEDFKFDLRHFDDVERVALVGESRWQKGMAAFCKPFTRAWIRYFDHSRLEEALAWAAEEDAA